MFGERNIIEDALLRLDFCLGVCYGFVETGFVGCFEGRVLAWDIRCVGVGSVGGKGP